MRCPVAWELPILSCWKEMLMLAKTVLANAMWTLVVAGMLVAAGCGGEEEEHEGPVPSSDPEVLATYEAWERECILWIRTGCHKAQGCAITPASNCWDSDAELRAECRAMVEGECQMPDPESFERCGDRTANESCQEYCDGGYCFDFCFYSCLD
jgi:hypothetical protein